MNAYKNWNVRPLLMLALMMSAMLSTSCLRTKTKTVYVSKPCLVSEAPKYPKIEFHPAGNYVVLGIEHARLLTLYLYDLKEWVAETKELCGEPNVIPT